WRAPSRALRHVMTKLGEGSQELICDVGTQQAPSIEDVQGRIDFDCCCDDCAGGAHALLRVNLCGCQPAICGLELEREKLALIDDQKIGNAGDDAERRGLDRRAPAAGWIMENEQPRHSAPAQVFEHGALQLGFKLAAAGAHRMPSANRSVLVY